MAKRKRLTAEQKNEILAREANAKIGNAQALTFRQDRERNLASLNDCCEVETIMFYSKDGEGNFSFDSQEYFLKRMEPLRHGLNFTGEPFFSKHPSGFAMKWFSETIANEDDRQGGMTCFRPQFGRFDEYTPDNFDIITSEYSRRKRDGKLSRYMLWCPHDGAVVYLDPDSADDKQSMGLPVALYYPSGIHYCTGFKASNYSKSATLQSTLQNSLSEYGLKKAEFAELKALDMLNEEELIEYRKVALKSKFSQIEFDLLFNTPLAIPKNK